MRIKLGPIIALFVSFVILRGNCDQIVIQDGVAFSSYFNTSAAPFQFASSPEEIGLHKLAGSQIWYIKSYQPTDNNIDFSTSFDLPKWICRGTQVQINIRYFSSHASITVWPVVDNDATHGGSSYASLPDYNEGWVNFVANVDINTSEKIVLDGVIMPMGHFLLDEVIFLYAGGECADVGITTTNPLTFPTTDYWDLYSTSEQTTVDYWHTTQDGIPTTPDYWHTDASTQETTEWYTRNTVPPRSLCSEIPAPTGTDVPPNEGLNNFLLWKLLCFESWALSRGLLSDEISVDEQFQFTNGEIYAMNVTYRNFTARSLFSLFSSFGGSTYSSSDLNGGNWYIYLEPSQYESPKSSVSAGYEATGSVLDTLSFSAIGEARGTVGMYFRFSGHFSVKNGHISYDCDQSLAYSVISPYNVNITGFQDDQISPALMTEFRKEAVGQMSAKLVSLYAGLVDWNTVLKPVLCQFMTEIFTEYSVLDIIKTPYPPNKI